MMNEPVEDPSADMIPLADSGMPLLRAIGISKSYAGVPALLDGRIELWAGSVHALCGGNGAGKSTFLGVLTGLHEPDGGHLFCRGREVRFRSPAAALDAGISIITQELSPVPDMTVAENIYLGREPRRGRWFVGHAAMRVNARALLEQLQFDVDASAKMHALSAAQIQLVEIAKAIGRDSSILIMDEPTSAIGEKETGVLLQAIRRLQSRGVGIIYISHRLPEIFEIADTYTVLRDGRFVRTGALADIERQELIHLIVGRALAEDQGHRVTEADGRPLIEVRNLTRSGQFEDIELSVRRGEIVGLYGLMGSGRSAFAMALYGCGRTDAGSVLLDGRPVVIRSPSDALRLGIAMVTEDRKRTGLVLSSSVRANISVSSLARFARLGFIDGNKEAAAVDVLVHRFGIKLRARDQMVRELSGGNQQKVVFARALLSHPRLLICDEPTRGVDEGAKREIHGFLRAFTAAGNAVLMISSEIPEIVSQSDRIVIFRRGRIAAELRCAAAAPDTLVHLAS